MKFSEQYDSEHDVLLTGVGMVTPLGLNRDESWKRLLAGDVAGRELTDADIEYLPQLADLLKQAPGGAPVDHEAVAELALTVAREFPQSDTQHFSSQFAHDELNNLIVAAFGESVAHAKFDPAELASSTLR